ncbi:conserved hypothetical protein; possible dithiol-disulfide isomerase [Cytophaga hutchinsonii ATCC 33406]|uniref:Dithiol-disulfide isomerase n=3 Tax=Cytophaga hutchinsonii TaxID=985 RepID=A0A6N4ST81_CYTH3|nr:conserved hypothetical protein; possible dithiol-disulfide isomerase [Cytophaga hutchinsonii ATCC 33406]SFX66608.1 Predicted dithiol-disulfide isomerase, DsbA family [Cytophaga hutchinsonii ATCC 33406]
MVSFVNCRSQIKTNMQEQNNPLLCNPESGFCEMPSIKPDTAHQADLKSDKKPVKVIYYTDPICSSCWGIEPQLRKLKLEYGTSIDIEYRMGGLLPDWSYNSGGISKPSDVAHHWDEVSVYYDMPIDGGVWLEDPLPSSYPPSIAFKAVQIQSTERAILFLREIREMVFLQKKNIAKWEHLEQAAKNTGVNIEQFKKDYEGRAKDLFYADLKLARDLGVHGFPTMIFSDSTGKNETVYGYKPYAVFENTIAGLYPSVQKYTYDKSIAAVFSTFHSLTAKEFSELTGVARNQSEQMLDEYVKQGMLQKWTTKNGSLWSLKK